MQNSLFGLNKDQIIVIVVEVILVVVVVILLVKGKNSGRIKNSIYNIIIYSGCFSLLGNTPAPGFAGSRK